MCMPDGRFFRPGCDHEALWGFEEWAARAEQRCGSDEPIITSGGRLLFHTAWTGPEAKIATELSALIDSFLMTQDTSRATFTVWWMDRDPDPTAPLETRYTKLAPSAVQFRRADLRILSEGTCLHEQHDFIDVNVTDDWQKQGTIGPKEKSDMTRLLILHQFGGVWVDTDTVILRDFRPLVNFVGEFAGKVTLSQLYNNNVLVIRKHSPVSTQMVDFVCQTPYSRNTGAFCKLVGAPCYPKWYVQQSA